MTSSAAGSVELVVDLAHRDLVDREISTLRDDVDSGSLAGERTSYGAEDKNLELGLVEVGYAGAPPRPPEDLLHELRARFERRYGWTPTIDLNQTLTHVGSFRHANQVGPVNWVQGGSISATNWVQGGGSGVPEHAAADEIVRRERDARDRSAEASDRVRVGVLDTAIFPNALLFGSCAASADAVLDEDRSSYHYLSGHSTFIAGLIRQKAPLATIEIHRVLSESQATATAWQVAKRMAELANSGLDVLNLSLGCFTDDGTPPLLFTRAVELLTPQMVVVTAAGNYAGAKQEDGRPVPPVPFWPASLDNVAAVGARDAHDRVASFSPVFPWVDFTAPGVRVLSTYLRGQVDFPDPPGVPRPEDWPTGPMVFDGAARWSGTSFAAATVSGVLARYTVPGRKSAREVLDGMRTDAAIYDRDVHNGPS